MSNIALIFIAFFSVACSQSVKPNLPPTHQSAPSQPINSGGRVGNGGGVIRCAYGHDSYRIELFDFFEAKVGPRHWLVNLDYEPDPNRDILGQAIETAKFVIDSRWRPIDPVLADYLTETLNEFPLEIDWQTHELRSLTDLENIITPPQNCKYLQMAVQITPELPGDKRYTIRKDLFEDSNFPNSNRAGLILHELIYRLTSLAGAEDSRSARFLTSIFFSGNQAQLTGTPASTQYYFEQLKNAKMPWAGASGVAIRLDKPYSFFSRSIRTGSAIPGMWAETPIGRHQIACDVGFTSEGQMQYFSIGNPKGIISNLTIDKYKDLTLISDIWRANLPSENWEIRYLSNECDDYVRGNDFNQTVGPDGVKITGLGLISPCIETSFENKIYNVSSCVNRNLIFTNDGLHTTVAGRSDVLANGRLTFHTGDVCENPDWVSANAVSFDSCAARVVDERFVIFSGIYKYGLDKFVIVLDEGREQSFKLRMNSETLSIKAKPGSNILIDEDGNILEMKIGENKNLCASNFFASNSQFYNGDTLVFDRKTGCVAEVFRNAINL